MITNLLDYLGDLATALAAIAAGILPRRHWPALHRLPIRRFSLVSGALVMVAGLVIGARGGLAYAIRTADALADVTLEIATQQASGKLAGPEITTSTPQALSALSFLAFLLFTPLGWLSGYLAASGLVRTISAVVDQPHGDHVLTGLDALLARSRQGAHDVHQRRLRERQEGVEVPDRLYSGDAAGLTGVDFVVVSSRRKADWTPGTFVITGDKWYVVGSSFEVRLDRGLRTFYPLTELKTAEVLRRGVRYELPPLQQAPPGALRPDRQGR